MAEEIASNLTGHRISRTFRGLIHFPHSIDTTTFQKQIVYDGQGTPTSLTLGGSGMGMDISGNTTISNSLSVTQNVLLSGNMNIGGDIRMIGGGKINEVAFNEIGSDVSLRAISGLEAGKVRIRESKGNFEFIYGNPTHTDNTKNLFTLKVNNDTAKNFYIKNDYNQTDINSPLWINRNTGEVNIRNLVVSNIKTVLPPSTPKPPTIGPRTDDSHRNDIPIGMISIFPTLNYNNGKYNVPDGWLECDGFDYAVDLFPELFAIIKWNYSPPDMNNSSRFCVPDLRGLFVRGLDHKRTDETTRTFLDVDNNRTIGSYQQDTFKSHKHMLDGISNQKQLIYQSYAMAGAFYSITPVPGLIGAVAGAGIGIGGSNAIIDGSGGKTLYTPDQTDPLGAETRPKNIAMIYGIKW